MKMTKIMLGGLLAITATANAMPTQEETKQVEPLVMDLMKDDQVALKSGKKTRVEVAESAMSLADKADTEAAKLLLIKGAFNLYVRAGEFDKAIETLQALQAAIPDIPPANMANIIESSLRVVPRKNGGQLYRLLDETKLRMRYTSAAKKMEKTLKENPTDRQLRTKLAEHYAYLGKWDQALENFAAAEGKAGLIAKSERDGDATEKVADFWWAYPNGKSEELVRAFRVHAAKLYEDAIADGKISGLNKVQAERRIEEAREYGSLIDFSDDEPFLSKNNVKLQLSRKYELELIRCIAGEFEMGYECWKKYCVPLNRESRKVHKVKLTYDYMLGRFPVTVAQWAAVMGGTVAADDSQTPVSNISVEQMEKFCEHLTQKYHRQIGKNIFRLPTEAEWEYAAKAGQGFAGLLGKDEGQATLSEMGYCRQDHAKNSKQNELFVNIGLLPVGKFKANEWGFQDMTGNAFEVMLDSVSDYGPNLPSDGDWRAIANWVKPWSGKDRYLDSEIDPLRKGTRRILRGGFRSDRNGASAKLTLANGCKLPCMGFRLCLGPDLVSVERAKK